MYRYFFLFSLFFTITMVAADNVNDYERQSEETKKFLAAGTTNIDLLRTLLTKKINVNACYEGDGGFTPLLRMICFRKDIEGVKFLLEAGADVNQSSCCMSPLMEAAWTPETNHILALLARHKNIKIDMQQPGRKKTALIVAADRNCFCNVITLLQAGAKQEYKDDLNHTALDKAKRDNNTKMQKLLMTWPLVKDRLSRMKLIRLGSFDIHSPLSILPVEVINEIHCHLKKLEEDTTYDSTGIS